MIFSKNIYDAVASKIEDRVVTVIDLQQRKHPILPQYKIGDTQELTRTLLNILVTLSDSEKDQIIETLEQCKKKTS